MESNFIMCYNGHHETLRKPDAIGEAAPTSDPVAREGHELVGGGSTGRILRKLCFSMAAGLSKGRGGGPKSQSLSGSSCQALKAREEAISKPFAERPFSLWLRHRSLDHEAGGRANSQVFWNPLSSQSPLATSDGVRMELSETRAPGSGKERRGDRTLEEETMAGNKKKPSHLEPIWPLSMRVGFCSFPMFVGHGHRRDKLLSCIIFTGETEFRPSPVLPSRPRGGTWGFTSDSKGRILRLLTWESSCTTSCSTSVLMLFSYGTKLSSIGENQSETSSIATQDSMWNGSPDMPLSSILSNSYGLKQSADWPIAPQKGQRNLSECCAVQPDASNIPNVSSGLASGPLNCLGKDDIFSINYA
jgi:hypothetical protein